MEGKKERGNKIKKGRRPIGDVTIDCVRGNGNIRIIKEIYVDKKGNKS